MTDEPPFRFVIWDDELEKTPSGSRALMTSYVTTELWIGKSAPSRELNQDLACDIHRMLFGGVFPRAAGKCRHNATGFDQPVSFDGIPAPHFRDLPEMLNEWSQKIRYETRAIANWMDEDSPERHLTNVYKIAAYAHCELVRMHPFVNGNGRTARTCLNYFAHRYRLKPMIIHRERDDKRTPYIVAANDWVRYHEPEPFIAFLRKTMPPLQS